MLRTTRSLLTLATLTVATVASRNAHAVAPTSTYEWVALPVAGCASAIAVGPNDVPWILGCSSNGGASPNDGAGVYYLQTMPCPSGTTCLSPTQQWTYDGFTGVTLSVNLNGEPWATDTTGTIYGDARSLSWEMAHGSTVGGNKVAYPGGAGSWGPAGRGAVSEFVAMGATNSVCSQQNEMFWLSPTCSYDGYGYYWQNAFFGLGCGSSCTLPTSQESAGYSQVEKWSFLSGDYNSGWTQNVPPAIRLAAFTNSPSLFATTQDQAVWGLTSGGGLWAFDYNNDFLNTDVTPPGSGTMTTSITDHYALSDGSVYEWTGQVNGTNGSWTQVLSPFNAATGFVWLKQIAFSEAIGNTLDGPNGVIGPSELWGIDFEGNVYRAQWVVQDTPM